MSKPVTVSALFYRPMIGRMTPAQPMLRCPVCRETWPANPADYWQYPESHAFRCSGTSDEPHARVAVQLVDRVVRFVRAVRPEAK